MPYINQADRPDICRKYNDDSIQVDGTVIFASNVDTAGELQYAIAELIKEFIGKDYKYQNLNDVMGALAGAQQEFYRQTVAPYEDIKIAENGGV